MDLHAEASRDAVGEHPFDEEAWVEGAVVGGALVGGGFEEGGGEEDVAAADGEAVGLDEVARELVVGAVGEDEFDLVVGCEGVEVLEAEAVSGGSGAGALYVDDLVDGAGDFCEGPLAAGFDHEGVVHGEEAVHEGEEIAGLEHGLAAGELDEAAGLEGLDVGDDLVVGEGLAAGEGVLGVAPGAAQVAACEPHKDAGNASEGAFTLDRFVELDEMHLQGCLVVACEAGVGLVEGAVFDADAAGSHFVHLRGSFFEEVAGEVFSGGVEGGEGLEVVDHLVIEVVDGGAKDLLEELEVEEKAGLIEFVADESDEDAVVVAVRVFALAAVVAEVVA